MRPMGVESRKAMTWRMMRREQKKERNFQIFVDGKLPELREEKVVYAEEVVRLSNSGAGSALGA